MTQFRYLVKNSEGKNYKGTLEAKDEAEVRERLKGIGFYVVSIKREMILFRFKRKKVPFSDLVVFFRQFSVMIEAGISILFCLKSLERQTQHFVLKGIINQIRVDIESGISLSNAMSKHPAVFPDFYIALIRAAETSGMLNEILQRLANHFESQDKIKRAIRNAFAYPLIVGIITGLVVSFLLLVIVPIFQDIYIRMHIILPFPTLVLIGVSKVVKIFWWLILGFVTGTIFLFRWADKNLLLSPYTDKLKAKIPIFGIFLQKAAVARFIRTFGDMISSGVSILDSLQIAEKVADNRIIYNVVKLMTDSVYQGNAVSNQLDQQDSIPASVVQMIKSGEETGKLDFMLEKAADMLDRDVDDSVKRLIVKIEPLMTFFMALLVGGIAIAIYLPIFDVLKYMSVK
ncbi:type II secretion system F family protein [bacterium]|nr:type II secretion system F family protein [bacterium]